MVDSSINDKVCNEMTFNVVTSLMIQSARVLWTFRCSGIIPVGPSYRVESSRRWRSAHKIVIPSLDVLMSSDVDRRNQCCTKQTNLKIVFFFRSSCVRMDSSLSIVFHPSRDGTPLHYPTLKKDAFLHSFQSWIIIYLLWFVYSCSFVFEHT